MSQIIAFLEQTFTLELKLTATYTIYKNTQVFINMYLRKMKNKKIQGKWKWKWKCECECYLDGIYYFQMKTFLLTWFKSIWIITITLPHYTAVLMDICTLLMNVYT